MKSPSLLPFPDRHIGSVCASFLRASIVATSAFTLASASPASAHTVSTDVDFSVIYNASLYPNDSSPAWQLLTGGTPGTATISGGALTLDTPTAGSRYYRINNTNVWNGGSTTGSTIEFSLKVDSLSDGATNSTIVYFSTGTKGYGFFFRPNEITYQGGAAAPVFNYDTSSDFNRYRITLSDAGEASLFINNSATPLISGYMGSTLSPSTNFIYFGDASNGAGGIVHWEYFAFTNSGAIAPIPEGSTVTMTLLGCSLLGLHLAKRRKADSLQ